MHVSKDNQWMFMSNELGYIKQFNHKMQKFEKSWGQVMGGQINRIIGHNGLLYVSDSKSYYTKGPVGNLRVFGMADGKLMAEWNGLVPAGILDMVLIPGDVADEGGLSGKMILAGADGFVREFDLAGQKITKTWTETISGVITAMVM
jgi:hypothetical protein